MFFLIRVGVGIMKLVVLNSLLCRVCCYVVSFVVGVVVRLISVVCVLRIDVNVLIRVFYVVSRWWYLLSISVYGFSVVVCLIIVFLLGCRRFSNVCWLWLCRIFCWIVELVLVLMMVSD